jgi:molecular chaperone GrpE
VNDGSSRTPDNSEEEPRVVIRDRRRIDPTTGAPRASGRGSTGTSKGAPAKGGDGGDGSSVHPSHDGGPSGHGDTGERGGDGDAQVAALNAQLAERTADLQRLQAEYANYRKRVERDRVGIAEQAVGTALTGMLPVLDDLDRAAEHGDLVGPFAAVAEKLIQALQKVGLTSFGDHGDPFDPTWHEAVMHSTSPEVTEPTCVEVLRRGYALGERMLRPAMVAVAEPDGDAAPAADPVAGPGPSADGDGDGEDDGLSSSRGGNGANRTGDARPGGH